MRVAKVNLYNYDELPEKVKERVLEQLYDINIFSDWHEAIFEQYYSDLREIGYGDVEINYSGFYSQGDGASFTASELDMRVITKRALSEHEYDFLWHYCDNVYCSDGVYRSGNRYYHYLSIDCGDVECETSNKLYYALRCGNKRVEHVAELIERRIYQICESLQAFILDEAREISKRIYRELQKKYEYLTDDEAIVEAIIANEYEFTSDGELAKRIYYNGE